MQNTKAIIGKFGTANEIKIISEPMPEPGPGEVRIKIEAATVSSTDVTIRKGLYPLLKDKPPFTLGYDFVGIVDKTGEGVTGISIGERVADICQVGGNTQYICRQVKNLLRISKEIKATDAAPLILSGMTAYQIFKYAANVKQGDSFLVHGGSGAVGNILLQLCKLHKVKTVSTSSATKTKLLEELGAIGIDYNSVNYFSELEKHKASGFDAAIDFSNQKSINHSFKLLKKGGRMILCGLLSTQRKMEAKTLYNFLKFGMEFGCMMLKKAWWNIFSNKKTIFFGIVDSKKEFPERYQSDLNELINLVKTGKLKPHIHETIRLEQIATAHQWIDDAITAGQTVIDMC